MIRRRGGAARRLAPYLCLRAVAAALLMAALSACGAAAPTDANPPIAEDAPRVVIETSLGDIVVGLYQEQAPITVANFLSYVETGHYDNTVFHRVRPGFMIQGGGFRMQGDRFVRNEVREPIVLESDTPLKNYRGAISMARTMMPDSATDQFFINLVHNQFLDRFGDVELGYAVFGQVLEGMEVVDAIAAVPTERPDPSRVVGAPPFQEEATPVEDVVIRTIRLVTGD